MEKLWIVYELDIDGSISFQKIIEYVRRTATPPIKFSDSQLQDIYSYLRSDYRKHLSDDLINKYETFIFFKVLLSV